MGSAWNCSAKERSADGKFSAEFDGLDLAMGAPSLSELRLYASAETQGLNLNRKESNGESENVKFSRSGEIEQILLSEQATACFTFSDDSRFLAFAE